MAMNEAERLVAMDKLHRAGEYIRTAHGTQGFKAFMLCHKLHTLCFHDVLGSNVEGYTLGQYEEFMRGEKI